MSRTDNDQLSQAWVPAGIANFMQIFPLVLVSCRVVMFIFAFVNSSVVIFFHFSQQVTFSVLSVFLSHFL